jgi:hypothetical protein
MKQRIMLYCGEDAAAGKAYAAFLRNRDADVSQNSVFEFDGKPERCDRVVFMPDVPGWLRKRLTVAYGGKVSIAGAPEASPKEEAPAPSLTVGKGPRGKFYVKRGTERIAGPFESQADAETDPIWKASA